jgi:hypothetical protein
MDTAIDLQETSSLFYTAKSPIEWIISKLDITNYPRFKFDTSLTYPNLIVIDNSTTLGLERKDILDELKGAYEFSNIEEIRNFILQNSYLVDILKEAPENIYRIFGKSIKLILELHSDPEEDFEELFVVIKSPYAPQKARELMNELDRTWFLNIMDKTQGKLCITEEYL